MAAEPMMLPGLFKNILRLVVSWWRVDRIRVGPSAGRLLQLEIGSYVSIEGHSAEVISRKTERRNNNTFELRYWCQTPIDSGELCVEADNRGRIIRLHWFANGKSMPLLVTDVQTYRPNCR